MRFLSTISAPLLPLLAVLAAAPAQAAITFNQTSYDTGGASYTIRSGDLNGDGKLDLVTANDGDSTVSVMLGNGNGTFAPYANYFVRALDPGSIAAHGLVVADFNGDGKLDAAVTGRDYAEVDVLLGNGSGGLGAAISSPSSKNSFSLAGGDFNGDGKPDLASVDYMSNQVTVLIGNGNGTFATPVYYTAGQSTYGVTVADLNGDGKPDIAVANNASSGGDSVSVLLNNGNGTFAAATTYAAGRGPRKVSTSDLNGDGKLDLIVANFGASTPAPGTASLSVLLNNGNGTFAAATDYPTTDGTKFAGTYIGIGADLDGDAKPELVSGNNNGRTVGVRVGNGDGTFGAQTSYVSGQGTGSSPRSFVVADFNGDGKLDLAAAQSNLTTGDGGLLVLLNTTTPVATPTPAPTSTPVPTNAPPVLANIESTTATFTQGGSPVQITNAITVADSDNANLSGATVRISSGLVSSEDQLLFTSQNGISSVYSTGTGILTLSGSATKAQYQTALRSVTYNNSNTTSPSTSNRIVSFQVNDGGSSNNLSNTVTRTISIALLNKAPVNSVPGPQSTNEDNSLVFSSANSNRISISDADAGSGTLTVTLTITNGLFAENSASTRTLSGTVASLNSALTTLTYVPTANFFGTSTLTIVTNDNGNTGAGGAKTDTDTVSITVNSVNDNPTANNDSATVAEDSGATSINVLGNDSIAPDTGETLTVTAVTQPANGSVTFSSSAVIFTPAANFNGTTSFTYTISDGNGGTATATVNVTVTPVNDNPTANNDSATVAEDSGATVINVLGNDSSAPDTGETLTVTSVTQPTAGTGGVTLTSGVVRFTPALNFNGTTTFTYTISDGNGGTATATVTMTVTPVNDNPTANTDSATVAEDSSATIVDVLANDSIAPDTGETLTVTAVTQPVHGTVTLVGGVVTYKPDANYNGPDSFTYTISDGNGGTDTATVNVTVTSVNDNPTANNDSATVAEDSNATAIGVLSNDSIAPDTGETLTVTAVTAPTHGTVTLTNGVVRYKPAANFNGTDTFTYTISDGNGGTDTATVTMTVTSVNDNPTANNDTATVAEDSSATAINVLGNDSIAPDTGETLTVTAVTSPSHGTAALVNGVVTYKPDANYNGPDSFTYTISDGNGGTDTATVTMTVSAVNDAPVISSVTITPASPKTKDLLTANVTASDIDGDTLTYTYVWKNGTTTLAETGPTLNLATVGNGDKGDTITVTVTANDGTADSAPVTSAGVTVVNTAPVISSVSITPATPATRSLLTANVVSSDADLDSVTYSYQWNKNGQPLTGATGPTLDLSVAGNGDDGDTITVTVIATDSDSAASPPVTSDSVTISNIAPVVVSVSPQGLTDNVGTKRTFTLTMSDGNGASDIAEMWLLINTQLDSSNGATLIYKPDPTNPTNGLLYLRRGDSLLDPIQIGTGASSSAVLDNGAVRIVATDVTVSVSGNAITLNLPLTIRDGLVGSNLLFARAQDRQDAVDLTAAPNEFGFVRSGSYKVIPQFAGSTNSAPTLSKLTPGATNTTLNTAGIASAAQTFSFIAQDADGIGDMESMWFLAGPILDWGHSATFVYYPRTRRLVLRSDDGNSFLGGAQIGTAGILENSQVRVDMSKVKLLIYNDGKSLGLSLPLQAKSGLIGNNKIWLRVQDNQGAVAPGSDNLGFVQSGTWTVKQGTTPPAAPAPSAGNS